MEKMEKMWQLLKAVTIVSCSLLFLIQMVEVWRQFINEKTFVAVSHVKLESLKLPELTICPIQAYKSVPKPWNASILNAHQFSQEDIFVDVDAVKNSKKLKLVEVPSRFYIMCQKVSMTGPVKAQDYSFAFRLKNLTDYIVYIHEPGEEFWLRLGIYPYEMTTVKLSSSDVGSADIVLRKEMSYKLKSGQEQKCDRDHTAMDYSQCSLKTLQTEFPNKANCTFYLLEDFHPDKSLPLCTSFEESEKALMVAQHILMNAIKEKKCSEMCDVTRYHTNMAEYHRNIMPENEGLLLFCFYATMSVDHKTEKYIYGFETALVAVGGSMGLFLGLSCMSIILSLIEWTQKKLK